MGRKLRDYRNNSGLGIEEIKVYFPQKIYCEIGTTLVLIAVVGWNSVNSLI